MNWIKRKVIKWVREDWENERVMNRYGGEIAVSGAPYDSDSVDTAKGFTVKIQVARGGRIVSFNHYDRKTDRSENSVYVIPEEQNFNEVLVNLINLESYR
jgi:hypothetical protein